jgi:hypothetical protein
MIIIDPSSYHFQGDRLLQIDAQSTSGQMEPLKKVVSYFEKKNRQVHTSDYLENMPDTQGQPIDFYSFGMFNYKKFLQVPNIRFKAFVFWEPPVVAPRLFKLLPELTATFERVYVWNTHGDGYSLENVNQKNLRQFYIPIELDTVRASNWEQSGRLNKIVVINSLQNPHVFRWIDMTRRETPSTIRFNSIPEIFAGEFSRGELYSKRLEAVGELAKVSAVDLYGRGWGTLFSPRAIWPTFLLNRSKILSVWKGSCPNKFEVLSKYRFCLVIENQVMDGWFSEKMIDCFSTGTIPLYWGAKDIARLVPANSYISCHDFPSLTDLWKYVEKMSDSEVEKMRLAGKDFFSSEIGRRHFNSMNDIFEVPVI